MALLFNVMSLFIFIVSVSGGDEIEVILRLNDDLFQSDENLQLVVAKFEKTFDVEINLLSGTGYPGMICVRGSRNDIIDLGELPEVDYIEQKQCPDRASPCEEQPSPGRYKEKFIYIL